MEMDLRYHIRRHRSCYDQIEGRSALAPPMCPERTGRTPSNGKHIFEAQRGRLGRAVWRSLEVGKHHTPTVESEIAGAGQPDRRPSS